MNLINLGFTYSYSAFKFQLKVNIIVVARKKILNSEQFIIY